MTADMQTARSEEVLAHLKGGTEPATIAKVASELSLTHRQARDTLAYLAKSGQAVRVDRGRYRAPVDKRPDNGGRRSHGTTTQAAQSAIDARPEAVWTAQDLAEDIGIAKNHATSILTKLVKRGVMGRVGFGRYQLGAENTWRGPSAASSGWEPLGTLEDAVLLRDEEGQLWLAAPASVSQLNQAS